MITGGRQIQYFLFSQYLADGIRVTVEILMPVILFWLLDDLQTGITLASGAFCVALCDMPGPQKARLDGMLYATGFMALMSLLTGLATGSLVAMAVLISFASFFFSMLGVYGNRASAVGTAALLMMVIRMRDDLSFNEDLWQTLLITAGACWYLVLAMAFNLLAPFRPAQRSVGQCLHETAAYLLLKADMYEENAGSDEAYQKLLTKQVSVNEIQDTTRELLFKNREITRESSKTGRSLLMTFIHSVDLFEQVTASWFDQHALKDRFRGTGILPETSRIIREMARELDNCGLAIQSNKSFSKSYDWLKDLDALKTRIDHMNDGSSHFILKKLLVNLRSIGEHIDLVMQYFHSRQPQVLHTPTEKDVARFVSHRDINPVVLINNIGLSSASFRHAARMAITCLAAYLFSIAFASGPHSYWIVLTVIFILKPGFSLTSQRNNERIIGTIAGGVVALLILYLIKDKEWLFAIVVLCMIGTYSFQRLNYLVMVFFITPYLLIVLHLLDMGFTELVRERLVDTAIAFVLAWAANHQLFPNWESAQIRQYMAAVLQANLHYLEKLGSVFAGNPPATTEYRLARKEMFVSSANLTAAFHRMLSEPKSKQGNRQKIYEFVVLNQILASNIASITGGAIGASKTQRGGRQALLKTKRIHDALLHSLQTLSQKEEKTQAFFPDASSSSTGHDDAALNEQLDYIAKISNDLRKTVNEI